MVSFGQGLGLERRHLLLLFIAGLASRGFVKTLLGANASIALLLLVALYYLYMKRHSESIYDEIARQQATAALKLDAIHGVSAGDAKLSAVETLAARQTHFQLNESDRMVVTDRMHQYASKMGGNRKDRKKFLVTRPKMTEAAAIALSNSETIQTRRTSDKTEVEDQEKRIEENINETL